MRALYRRLARRRRGGITPIAWENADRPHWRCPSRRHVTRGVGQGLVGLAGVLGLVVLFFPGVHIAVIATELSSAASGWLLVLVSGTASADRCGCASCLHRISISPTAGCARTLEALEKYTVRLGLCSPRELREARRPHAPRYLIVRTYASSVYLYRLTSSQSEIARLAQTAAEDLPLQVIAPVGEMLAALAAEGLAATHEEVERATEDPLVRRGATAPLEDFVYQVVGPLEPSIAELAAHFSSSMKIEEAVTVARAALA